jgi:hypothetical protein
MFVHLPILMMAATFTPVAVSDTVPKFDIARECRFEGASGDSSVDYDRCSADEGAALGQLQNTWTQFTGGDKKSCIASTTIGGFESYVELMICLQMARDANDENAVRDRQSADSMRPHASGKTVGIGHGPATSGQTPGRDNQ